MNLIEKLRELVVSLNSSVYMPYENVIISIHDTHGETHTEYAHAEPFVIIAHICCLMDRIESSLHMSRKDVLDLIAKTYMNGGDDFDEQADQGNDSGDTGTPAGDS